MERWQKVAQFRRMEERITLRFAPGGVLTFALASHNGCCCLLLRQPGFAECLYTALRTVSETPQAY